tara:strand:+ start:420 stop:572 length:153 start_codon:yes stop_codon:yes gene_type:complete
MSFLRIFHVISRRKLFSYWLNIQRDKDENLSTQSDVNGLLSMKVVDVLSQ